jgi:hypothetical protein
MANLSSNFSKKLSNPTGKHDLDQRNVKYPNNVEAIDVRVNAKALIARWTDKLFCSNIGTAIIQGKEIWTPKFRK